MKELYTSPIAEVEEFDKKDVITTSGDLEGTKGETANSSSGWSGLF